MTSQDPPDLTTEEFAQWWRETGERELRQVLFWRWDPIGVSEFFPNSADEYDGYAPQVVQALRKGASVDELVRLLSRLEHDEMGLAGIPLERLRPVASQLVAWYEGSQDMWQERRPAHR